MKFRTLFLFLILLLMAVFLVVNWAALSAVTTVNLVYTEVQAPLGAIVVCGFAFIIALLLIYMVFQAASVTMELRKAYKEARTNRDLADDAEKSRLAESKKELMDRLDRLEALMTNRTDATLESVREESSRVDEKLQAFAANVQKTQDEAGERMKAEVSRLLASLPAPRAEVVKNDDGSDAKKKKEIFQDLY